MGAKRTRKPGATRQAVTVSLYPRDLAAARAIIDAIAEPGGPEPSLSDAVRAAIRQYNVTTATANPKGQ